MYEKKTEPLASKNIFYKRVLWSLFLASIVLTVCLFIGILGYHYSDNIPWLDSLHNASMILSGMGPVVTITSNTGKWFSSFYALFSGVVFITNFGLILAPALHRLIHSLHVEDDDQH